MATEPFTYDPTTNTYTANATDISLVVIAPGTFTLVGIEGRNILSLGTSLRSSYTIIESSDGYVHVDSISSASGGGLHAKLKNIDVLTFASESDVLDLTTRFPSNITGTDANNAFTESLGNAAIDGGAGIDTMSYQFGESNYTITGHSSGSATVTKSSGGSDSLANVERLHFTDADIALDTDSANSAGGIYRLYQATFDRIPDTGGLGYWISQADKGESAVNMAEDFTWSQEFQDLYGVTTTDNFETGTDITALVTGFYENVLGRAPDQGGLDYYVGVIESHEKTVGRVLAEISDSPENYIATIGVIQDGIHYDLWQG